MLRSVPPLRHDALLLRGPFSYIADPSMIVLALVGPGSAAHRRRGAAPRPGHEKHFALTSLSEPSRSAGTFAQECCFQVIYFVSNISFCPCIE
jgi:hypothetical protein